MPAYCFANIEVIDPLGYEAYRSRTAATIEAFGGRFLVRGGEADVKEGGWRAHRIVLIEFPDLAAAQAWYASDPYQSIVPLRTDTARTELLLVDGVYPNH